MCMQRVVYIRVPDVVHIKVKVVPQPKILMFFLLLFPIYQTITLMGFLKTSQNKTYFMNDEWEPWYICTSVIYVWVCISHPAARRRVCGWGTCLFSKPHAKLLTGSGSCQGESPEHNRTHQNIWYRFSLPFTLQHTHTHTHCKCQIRAVSRSWQVQKCFEVKDLTSSQHESLQRPHHDVHTCMYVQICNNITQGICRHLEVKFNTF